MKFDKLVIYAMIAFGAIGLVSLTALGESTDDVAMLHLHYVFVSGAGLVFYFGTLYLAFAFVTNVLFNSHERKSQDRYISGSAHWFFRLSWRHLPTLIRIPQILLGMVFVAIAVSTMLVWLAEVAAFRQAYNISSVFDHFPWTSKPIS